MIWIFVLQEMDYVPWLVTGKNAVKDPRSSTYLASFMEPRLMALPEFAIMIPQPEPEFSKSHTWAGDESEVEDDASSAGRVPSPSTRVIGKRYDTCLFPITH